MTVSTTRRRSQARSLRTAEQRASERQNKRDALLLAAARTFNEKGFFAASLDDVAAAQGVTKPVIYHYLGNKEQVLFECLKKGMGGLFRAVEQARDQDGRGIDRLRAFLVEYALSNMTDFGRCVVYTTEEMLSPESASRFRTLKREIDMALRHLMEECIDDGSIRVANPKLAAFTFIGALNWPARWYRSDGALMPEEIAATMVDMLMRSILPPCEDGADVEREARGARRRKAASGA